ncbi:MAG: hypothetical protein JXB15_06500 [Anaerolineales bacterium]|nr:hypothetical protein [Anaerolineales bacterium]
MEGQPRRNRINRDGLDVMISESTAAAHSPVEAGQISGPAALADFWDISPAQRRKVLLEAILEGHARHYQHNRAYRDTVSARGVGPSASIAELPRLLRPTAQTFKSYIDLLGTPFPQDKPEAFLAWAADQISIELPRQRFQQFRQRYASLEALLQDFERIYADYGLEVSTSSGTSGRSTIMIRDQDSIQRTVESFYLSFQRYLGRLADHRAIFIMPGDTRIAMARMVGFSVKRVGIPPERTHFTIPFPAYPDQVRVRAGRTFRSGWRGYVERRWMNPFMNWMNEKYVTPRATHLTVELLERSEAEGERVLLFGGLAQLHDVALHFQRSGRALRLAPGSLLGTGGGFKELYAYTPEQILTDLEAAIQIVDGQPVPFRDVYGMAEGNWAAMQCSQGNYHIPPWIYAAVLDEDDRLQETPDSTGLLAFFDPFGGGSLFPAFFKSADRVRLVNGTCLEHPDYACPCGESGAYIVQGTIRRVDLLDEAGCAAQV